MIDDHVAREYLNLYLVCRFTSLRESIVDVKLIEKSKIFRLISALRDPWNDKNILEIELESTPHLWSYNKHKPYVFLLLKMIYKNIGIGPV